MCREVMQEAMADLEEQRRLALQKNLCTDLSEFLEDIVVQELWESQVEELAVQAVNAVP